MCRRKKETFSFCQTPTTALTTLSLFYFSECIHLDLPHLLLIFPPNSNEHKASHTLSSFILCSYPHLGAPLSLSGSPCASGSL